MDTREVLRPYKKQRLGFEGVLIDIKKPNRRNGYNYGLVFASVYAPNERIELDHVVIEMGIGDFREAGFKRFTRYYFTATIASYYKVADIMGISAERENFMLIDINVNKLREAPISRMKQPTMYVTSRIDSIMLCKGQLYYTEDELISTVFNKPNNGSVERFINHATEIHQQSALNRQDMIKALYA